MRRPMSSGMRWSSSSRSITAVTWRPRSKRVKRTSRSLRPAEGDGVNGGEGVWLMQAGGERKNYTCPRMTPLQLPLDYAAIERILPHRYPFLLVDRVTELDPDRRIVGGKNVSLNERYLWHGPGQDPVLPATILTEAIAQVGAILILSKAENREKLIFFMGIDRVRYRLPVHPGDIVEIEARVKR